MLRRVGLVQRRWVSAAALWPVGGYDVPAEGHAVEGLLEEVGTGAGLLRGGQRLAEASHMLERAHAIAEAAFGPGSESALHVRHLLALALFNAGRLAPAEAHLRSLLSLLDPCSPIDRFPLRVMRADALRRLGRIHEAAQASQVEPGDSIEQRLEMLTRQAWLLTQQSGATGPAATIPAPPHEVLNEAVELIGSLEEKSKSMAKYSAIVLALQALVSLRAGNFVEALERAEKAAKTIEQYRALSGEATGLSKELGDVLTVQGKALLGSKNFLRAEEVLDQALALFETDHARAAEALLALGDLFRQTSSNTYAEGTYRKLLAVIDRFPGQISREHIHEAYDSYAWFLRNHSRKKEAEEVEQEYIRLFHNKT